MQEGDTVYCAFFREGFPLIARGTRGQHHLCGWGFVFEEWVTKGMRPVDTVPRYVSNDSISDKLHATFPAARAWLIEQLEARLARQAQQVAQMRGDLEQLRELREE